VAAELAEPGDESGGPVVEHPAVSRKVEQPPGLLVAKQAAVEPAYAGELRSGAAWLATGGWSAAMAA
jgi:hypothetical protein